MSLSSAGRGKESNSGRKAVKTLGFRGKKESAIGFRLVFYII